MEDEVVKTLSQRAYMKLKVVDLFWKRINVSQIVVSVA